MSVIPIVMAANDAYVPYLGVAICSLIKHTSDKFLYKIYVLHTDIPPERQKPICDMQKNNVHVEFKNINEQIKEYNIPTVFHLRPETAYRLVIDQIFPEYEKVLYLDSDIVVCKDVAELYQEDISDYIIGAVRGRIVRYIEQYLKRELCFSMENYFNAGVLLVNVSRFAEEKIGSRGLKMLTEKTYICQDQDVLNLLCENKVKFLDGHWNVEWQHLTGLGGEVVIDKCREGTLEYVKEPYIIHYVSQIKPWRHPEIELADYFWEEAKRSVFFKEIVCENFVPRDLFEEHLVPWEKIPSGSRIVIYGYGNVGKKFAGQIELSQYGKVVAILDKKAATLAENDKVFLPEKIIEMEYDFVLIAVDDKDVVKQIVQKLLEMNVEKNKIVTL